jgi:hypothetical protein
MLLNYRRAAVLQMISQATENPTTAMIMVVSIAENRSLHPQFQAKTDKLAMSR